ncbi:YceI family protein [Mucilaginibacter antarcticus]|uniref:YceI family protein n=1 Tax=Mucilaginibacter antarcticus TaxID=1855725 RepID=A0ABW5XTD1_9SPHI
MKHIGILLLAWLSSLNLAGQTLFASKKAQVSLFSSAPIEDISAATSSGNVIYNAATGELMFSVPINTFKFPKSLMQEHFNSDYLESDKYPRATFKGEIQGKPDLTKDGTYPITVAGELDVHNVKQPRTIPGTLTVSNGVVTMSSEFMVRCVDHKIDIPRLVFKNIAERIKVTVFASISVVK